ncbi:hypothetical protein A3D42_00550 [Candidatus Nomurabacteria bacterium RIFCSPHIGHO2_02_FULL_41_18]|uniref:Uncharacterized protein n=1 Tax=Candidatus Nomurabacteria bacterium RIFCSPHIGHO2_02_FULL_41_18 TaxID=1801754 RepID=A0A1F6W7I3_9BACT|nr:MAG: hypothetical protein A2737_02545 [Candidatus Nomurabacteria bacterium RIFCSPHIGHO2_01_FULL_41_71]OGI77910.1 MAG: hypothetical protein A3D42_00550 [Candidatus Nomurabacteria bacterium RIFCSPHIGHO2_02_FULL_41_18]OGI90084.1 MAG: hypothetical protein A3B01_00970 [Candidatus Nomurabacteria bacterium RIFCSPLOWO2_01_FULL_41_52b]OGJ00252.1 MAG: hypothetical protein A3I90_01755 [Candidatus Nomurabacteria bacterium RIFCSPLOWO2_02_FULL_41_9]
MSNIDNKFIVFALQILLGLAFAVFVAPTLSHAGDTGVNYTYNTGSVYSYPGPYNYPAPTPVYNFPVNQTTYYPANTTQVVYYPVSTSNTSGSSTNKSSTAAKSTTDTQYNRTTVAVENQNLDSRYGNLAAGAIFGQSGFLPSGLVQWILLAILILLIIVLARKVFGGAKNYYSTPLKVL